LHRLGTGAAGRIPWHLWNEALYEPMRDFLSRPGKAMRDDLVFSSYRLAGGKGNPPPELGLFIEALHAGSLVVDDIEDDSEERRGLPALHRIYGMPAALNAGNWLYFWAFDLLDRVAMTSEARAAAHRVAFRALRECHYGQGLDLATKVDELAGADVSGVVLAISELKTGGLVALATGLGALAAGAEPSVVEASVRFGRDVGVGLQMLDDLSGITNDRRKQKGHEDLTQAKATWPWAWLSNHLDARSFSGLTVALAELRRGAAAEPLLHRLRALVSPIGRDHVHEHLERALSRFAAAVPAPVSALRQQLERLERSYGSIT
jgi:geranylgeranyl pyrophosphate synthase